MEFNKKSLGFKYFMIWIYVIILFLISISVMYLWSSRSIKSSSTKYIYRVESIMVTGKDTTYLIDNFRDSTLVIKLNLRESKAPREYIFTVKRLTENQEIQN